MQKKFYIGGLPWEIDRIGLLNYFKLLLEENEIPASYELPFIAAPLVNPNSSVRVTDVFVASDRDTGKSRGFGFVTIELVGDDAQSMFEKILELLQNRVQIGIRGPRELLVREADQRPEDGGNNAGGSDAEAGSDTDSADDDSFEL